MNCTVPPFCTELTVADRVTDLFTTASPGTVTTVSVVTSEGAGSVTFTVRAWAEDPTTPAPPE